MARDAKALLNAPLLPKLNGGAEIFVVETLLAHPDPTAKEGHEEERGLCLLVLVDPDERARRRVRAEAALYVGASCSVTPLVGSSWADKCLSQLSQLESAFVDLVLALPDYSESAARQVQALLRSLRSDPHHALCTSVAAAPQPADWSDFSGALGFVEATTMSSYDCAIWLHAGLAQLSAPALFECVSNEDLSAAWGTPTSPAQLQVVNAMNTPQAGALVRELGGGQGPKGSINAFLLDRVSFADYGAFRRTLRTRGFDSPVIVAPAGLTLERLPQGDTLCVIVSADDQRT